jgi:hypothetical protein
LLNHHYPVAEDGTTSISFEAGDVDGTVTTTATAANGTVEVKGDGTISYTPAADYNGKDTGDGVFTVIVCSRRVRDGAISLNFNRSVRCRRCCCDGSINIAGFKANARCTIFSHRFCTVLQKRLLKMVQRALALKPAMLMEPS